MPASSPCSLGDSRRLGEILREVVARLSERGIESARIDARLLIAAATGGDSADALLHPDRTLPESERELLESMVVRREAREPMSHILGYRGFWDHDFVVNADVLTPRPETEAIIEAVTAHLDEPPSRILDLGTGSGCLIVSLLSSYRGATGVAVDISEAALRVARDNAERLGLADRVRFVCGNWCEVMDETDDDTADFDLVVSNPPYIATDEIAMLAPEVRDYEPRIALDGGVDGLDAYRAISRSLADRVAPGGSVAVEIGQDQAAAVANIFTDAGYDIVCQRHDLAKIPRVIVARRNF